MNKITKQEAVALFESYFDDADDVFNSKFLAACRIAIDAIKGREADEQKLKAARAERDAVVRRMIQLEREGAALLADLKKADGDCSFCRHVSRDKPCEAMDCECKICPADCACKTCRDGSRWEWRGIVEDKLNGEIDTQKR